MKQYELVVFPATVIFTGAMGLILPLSVLIKMKEMKVDRNRWLKNGPALFLYVPFFFPLGTGILFAKFPWRRLTDWSLLQAILGFLVFTILLMIAVFAAVSDLKRQVIEPFMFKDLSGPLALEKRIRGMLTKKNRKQSNIQALLKEYSALAKPLATISGLIRNGSLCAKILFLLNLIIAVVIGFLFWHLSMHALFKLPLQKKFMGAAIGLFCMWFPLRMYSDWYLRFYSLKGIKSYYAFWLLSTAAILSYALYVYSSGGIAEVFSVSIAVLIGIIGVIGKIKPIWLGNLAKGMENLTFGWYLAINALVAISIFCMIGGMFFESTLK